MQQQNAELSGIEQRTAAIAPFKWQPGQSGNPKGRPIGGRNRLEDAFVSALADSFDRRGAEAIERCIDDDPVAYIRVIASLLPKDARIEINRSLTGLSDADLLRAKAALCAALGIADGASGSLEPSLIDVSPVPEAE